MSQTDDLPALPNPMLDYPVPGYSTYTAGQMRAYATAARATLMERIKEMEAALQWYERQSRLCRLIHDEGDAGRHALAADGGERARAALKGKP